jgi:hypothetical protein
LLAAAAAADVPLPAHISRCLTATCSPTAVYAADHVCFLQLCTLSSAGGDLLNQVQAGEVPQFDILVVDEAAQALEPATLIPLQLIKKGQ